MHVSDDIRLGPVLIPNADTSNPAPMSLGVGPIGRVYVWDTVPATLSTTAIAAVQTQVGAANFTLTASGNSASSVTRPDGTTAIQLDVPRAITLTVATTNQSGVNFTITGFDQYGQPLSELLAGPNNNTVTGKKAFKQVTNVACSAAVSTNGVSVGTSDTFGIPYRVTDKTYVVNVKWNNTLAADAGTVTVADTTSPATTSTGDVRGTYVPSSGASDGSKRLVMVIALPALAAGPSATRIGAVGVNQNLVV